MNTPSRNGRLTRFTADNPCPVCGGTESDPRGQGSRCHGFLAENGWIHCTREEQSSGCNYHPGSETYSHKPKGQCRCGVEHAPDQERHAARFRQRGEIESVHPYPDELGIVRFESVRYKNPKDFSYRRPDGNGGYIWNLQGVRKYLYSLPKLLEADTRKPVWIVEGEKKVEALAAIGRLATCNPGGALKWRDEYSAVLKGRICYISPDNDPPEPKFPDGKGREHARRVARSLLGKAASVKIVDLVQVMPDLKPKGDVVDFLNAGRDFADVERLALELPEWTPEKVGPESLAEFYESIDDPHRLARLFLAANPRMVYYQAECHLWEHSAYRPIADHEIAVQVAKLAKQEFDRHVLQEVKAWEERGRKDRRGRDCDPPRVQKVGTRLIGDVLQAIRGETLLSGTVVPPAWLIAPPPFPATDVLPTLNALVHLPRYVTGEPGAIIPPTADFFCPYALNYNFDPQAPEPAELGLFLASVWPKNDGSMDAFQEWLGYLLTLDKSQHKMAMLIGPPRSGRGTICRLIKKLIGTSNVANPTLSGLATPFGAECLIGKPVAIIGDARQSNRGDWAVALERILGITGDDSMTIARKHKVDWTGDLTTRLVLVSNELPRFPDQSGAIATRMLVFRFTESFLGHEDRTLDTKLQAELPGILLWAIEGWKRLRERGHFTQPDGGADLIDELRDLSSPTWAFVRERCDVGAEYRESIPDVFSAWKNWCADQNQEPGKQATLGRNLRAVCPCLKSPQARVAGERVRFFEGLRLKPSSEF